jgi:hypothetical protein
MKTLLFRRPYSRLREGAMPEGIINYDSFDYKTDGKTITSRRHYLIIDLWLVIVSFQWTTKVK